VYAHAIVGREQENTPEITTEHNSKDSKPTANTVGFFILRE